MSLLTFTPVIWALQLERRSKLLFSIIKSRPSDQSEWRIRQLALFFHHHSSIFVSAGESQKETFHKHHRRRHNRFVFYWTLMLNRSYNTQKKLQLYLKKLNKLASRHWRMGWLEKLARNVRKKSWMVILWNWDQLTAWDHQRAPPPASTHPPAHYTTSITVGQKSI